MFRINTKFFITEMVNDMTFGNLSLNKQINNSMSDSCFALPLNASIARFMNRTCPDMATRLINRMSNKWIHSNRARWSAIGNAGDAPSPTTIRFNSRVFVKLFNRLILLTLTAQSIHTVSVSQVSVVRG